MLALLVALRKESVDRNGLGFCHFCNDWAVALRKESVDRNGRLGAYPPVGSVALRKESVDRNTNFLPAGLFYLPVALRKESVDRNCEGVFLLRKITMSLSARRAWIEIRLWDGD